MGIYGHIAHSPQSTVHTLAQDGVLFSGWSLLCFLPQLHPVGADFLPPGAESPGPRLTSPRAHGPVGGRPSLGAGSAEPSAGLEGPLMAFRRAGQGMYCSLLGTGPASVSSGFGAKPRRGSCDLSPEAGWPGLEPAGGAGSSQSLWVDEDHPAPLLAVLQPPVCLWAHTSSLGRDARQLGLGPPRRPHSDLIASSEAIPKHCPRCRAEGEASHTV